jgi:hypothetical protein
MVLCNICLIILVVFMRTERLVQKALEFEKTDGTHLKSSTYALVFDFIDTYMHLRY